MKLGIMQPYFFPYLGYFELIEKTDRWVVFDVVQYKKKSWMNRNRILHPAQGFQYVGIPIQKTSRETLIYDVQIKDKKVALSRILGQINHYKKHAPYFQNVENLVHKAFESTKSDKLIDLNVSTLVAVCSYLNIQINWSLCSEMNLDFSDVEHPGQWALRIAAQLNAKTYINPPGGRKIFRHTEWDEAGINLKFTDMPRYQYNCSPYRFIGNLSILDVLMWNEPESIKTAIGWEANNAS